MNYNIDQRFSVNVSNPIDVDECFQPYAAIWRLDVSLSKQKIIFRRKKRDNDDLPASFNATNSCPARP